MKRRVLGVLVLLLWMTFPLSAQDVQPSDWTLTIQSVRTEAKLTLNLGVSRQTYKPAEGFSFLVTEAAITYQNNAATNVSLEISTSAFGLLGADGIATVAGGSAQPGSPCVGCVSTFMVEVKAGESQSLTVNPVFIIETARLDQTFLLQFQNAPWAAFTLEGAAPMPEPLGSDWTVTVRNAWVADSAPGFEPDSSAPLFLTVEALYEYTGAGAAPARLPALSTFLIDAKGNLRLPFASSYGGMSSKTTETPLIEGTARIQLMFNLPQDQREAPLALQFMDLSPTSFVAIAAGAPEVAPAQVQVSIEVVEPGNLMAEAVMIHNEGDLLDLSGWMLADEDGNTFLLPDGFQLFNDASLTIFSRTGQNTPAAVFQNRTEAQYSADEVVQLLDREGVVQVSSAP